MINTNDNEADGVTADRLYAARTGMAETNPGQKRAGIAELARVLHEPGRALSLEEQRALFSDAQLRADFRRLRSGPGAIAIPALAAASDGSVAARSFEGGAARMHASRIAGQIYVIFDFDRATDLPGCIILESTAGEVIKRALPAGDPRGRIMLILNQADVTDQAFLRLMADPLATGSLLL